MTKEYHRKYNIARYHKIRSQAIEKLGGLCVKCGATANLQFDHIIPNNKTFNVSNWLGRTLKEFWDELEKCQLLCQTCHIKKTYIDKGQIPAKGTHGTLSSYKYCHCNICKENKRLYTIEYRKAHPRKSSATVAQLARAADL